MKYQNLPYLHSARQRMWSSGANIFAMWYFAMAYFPAVRRVCDGMVEVNMGHDPTCSSSYARRCSANTGQQRRILRGSTRKCVSMWISGDSSMKMSYSGWFFYSSDLFLKSVFVRLQQLAMSKGLFGSPLPWPHYVNLLFIVLLKPHNTSSNPIWFSWHKMINKSKGQTSKILKTAAAL